MRNFAPLSFSTSIPKHARPTGTHQHTIYPSICLLNNADVHILKYMSPRLSIYRFVPFPLHVKSHRMFSFTLLTIFCSSITHVCLITLLCVWWYTNIVLYPYISYKFIGLYTYYTHIKGYTDITQIYRVTHILHTNRAIYVHVMLHIECTMFILCHVLYKLKVSIRICF